MGPYCRYCGHRCFVERRMPDDGGWQHDAAPYLWGDDHDPDAPPPEGQPCAVCSEPIVWDDGEWTHRHGDTYCGTGDGAVATPRSKS